MKSTHIIATTALLLFCGTAALSADTHVVFKAKMDIFGRGRTLKWESWACAGKQYIKAPTRPSILRGDLGLRWELYPGAKTYTETPIAPASGPVKEAPPTAPKNDKVEKDLRFAGNEFDETLTWRLTEAEETGTKHGIECLRHRLIGDSDHTHIELVVWVAPHGRDKGLALVPEALVSYKRFFDAGPGMAELFKKYPDGGIADLQAVLETSFGSDMKFSVEIESLEEAAAPAGIYDIPGDYKKGA